MGKATLNPPPVEQTVLLELSKAEALTLITVARFIAGPPNGRRRHVQAIVDALTPVVGSEPSGSVMGSIYLDSHL